MFPIPPDLERWGWGMSQFKSGPRKHPGGWFQFIFIRLHGLAAGDDDFAFDDPSMRVKVRRGTVDEAWAAAVQAMREASARLTPSPDYEARLAAHRARLADLRARADAMLAELERTMAEEETTGGTR
jgi:hypothetical protein